MVAILCADSRSVYNSLPDVEVYDADRDARTFSGGMPVVAHPPCRAWSAFCRHQAKPLPGEKDLAPMCVEWLLKCGGVLEHPAHSTLWQSLGLPLPTEAGTDGLWSAAVQQAWWGDCRSKNTWLLFAHIPRAAVEFPYRLHNPAGDRERWNRLSKRKRAATPLPLAKWLVDVARKARP